MSLLGLSGAHGTGKSTIIRGVKEFGVNVIESSLARNAQALLGWKDLKPAEESEEKMWEFQYAILDAMSLRDQTVLESRQYTLVDRTPADVWGYVALWSHRLGGANKLRLWDFNNKCKNMAAVYDQHIVVPISEAIPFVAEPGRADEASREFHEKEVCHFIITSGVNYMVLMNPDADARVRKLSTLLNSLQNNIRFMASK